MEPTEKPKIPPGTKILVQERPTPPNVTYDYDSLVSDPVPGIPPGAVLPKEMFPEDLRCPWCEDGPVYKTSQGLRGHAHGKHGLRWELPPKTKVVKDGLPDWNSFTLPEERESLEPWMMMALAHHEIYGWTWKEVGEKLHKNPDTISKIGKSPAGLKFRQKLHELFEEPTAIARLLLQANSVNATADYVLSMEWAREDKDYEVLGRMAKDLLKMTGGIDQSREGLATQELHIHIPAALVPDEGSIKTSYEAVEAEWEDEDGSI